MRQVIHRTVLWTVRWTGLSVAVGISLTLAGVPMGEDLNGRYFELLGSSWLVKTALMIPYAFVICFATVSLFTVLERRWTITRSMSHRATVWWSWITLSGAAFVLYGAAMILVVGVLFLCVAARDGWSSDTGIGVFLLLLAMILALFGIIAARHFEESLPLIRESRANDEPRSGIRQTLAVALLVVAAIVVYVGVMAHRSILRPVPPEVTVKLGGPVTEIQNYNWPVYGRKAFDAGAANPIHALHVLAPGNSRYDFAVSNFIGTAQQEKLVSIDISTGLPDKLDPTLRRAMTFVHQLALDTQFQPTLDHWRQCAASKPADPSCIWLDQHDTEFKLSNGVSVKFALIGYSDTLWIVTLKLSAPGYPEGLENDPSSNGGHESHLEKEVFRRLSHPSR